MKTKKIIILIFALLLISGCDANYEIDLNQEIFNEKLTINETSNIVLNERGEGSYTQKIEDLLAKGLYIQYSYNFQENLEENNKDRENYFAKYDIVKNNSNGLGVTITGKNDYYEMDPSTTFNSCFEKVEMIAKGKNVAFKTVGDFNCYKQFKYLNNVSIKVISNNFLSSNADSEYSDYHIWNFTKDNYVGKIISFEIKDLPMIDLFYNPEDEESSLDEDGNSSSDKSSSKDVVSDAEGNTIEDDTEDDISSTKEDIINKSKNKQTLLIIIIIIITCLFGVLMYYKYRKNNKI